MFWASEKECDIKKDWDDCITCIDEKGRDMKWKLKKQQVQQ